MNSAYNDYQDQYLDRDDQRSEVDRSSEEKLEHARRVQSYSRGKNRPSSYNGIHRRRNKRMGW